jgi:hypothetical protein
MFKMRGPVEFRKKPFVLILKQGLSIDTTVGSSFLLPSDSIFRDKMLGRTDTRFAQMPIRLYSNQKKCGFISFSQGFRILEKERPGADIELPLHRNV